MVSEPSAERVWYGPRLQGDEVSFVLLHVGKAVEADEREVSHAGTSPPPPKKFEVVCGRRAQPSDL